VKIVSSADKTKIFGEEFIATLNQIKCSTSYHIRNINDSFVHNSSLSRRRSR